MPEATRLRRLGRIDLELTPAGLGGAPLGNLGSVMPDEQAEDLVAAAWEDGVRYFDTAPAYGNGLSELRFGQALEGRPRDAFVLSTKVGCGLTPGEPEPGPWVDPAPYRMSFDYSYDGALRQLESSLERLRTDRVEIVYIHDVDVAHHGAAQPQRFAEAMSGSYRALAELREQGVVRAIGVGVNEAEVCMAAAEAGDFDCFLLAGRYTLLEQGAIADLLPLCEERDIAIVMGGVFNSGILATGAREGARYNYAPASPEILARVARIEGICARFGVPLGAAAAQFPLGHPSITSVVLGARRRQQQAVNHTFMTHPIPDSLWAALKADGALPASVPVPSATPRRSGTP
jgi:D-threo-aldose 1-dehydrogenase